MRFDEVAARLASLPSRLRRRRQRSCPFASAGRRPTLGRFATRWSAGRGAVLIVPDDDGEARIVLTERTTGGRHHSGEISFPGGRAEPDDADLVATALREAAEEIGLRPAEAGLRVRRHARALLDPVSNYLVTPVVSVAAVRPPLVAAPDEVARIIEAPVGLPRWRPIEIVERTIDDWTIRLRPPMRRGPAGVGATARILGQLGALLAIDGNLETMATWRT